jgi:hypothetical protein
LNNLLEPLLCSKMMGLVAEKYLEQASTGPLQQVPGLVGR